MISWPFFVNISRKHRIVNISIIRTNKSRFPIDFKENKNKRTSPLVMHCKQQLQVCRKTETVFVAAQYAVKLKIFSLLACNWRTSFYKSIFKLHNILCTIVSSALTTNVKERHVALKKKFI